MGNFSLQGSTLELKISTKRTLIKEFSKGTCIQVKGEEISETIPWGWHGIKQPSGKHNTIKLLLTRCNPGSGRIYRKK